MARGTSSRVLNTSRNCHIKRSQALARIAAGTAAWIDSRSIRELTMAEMLNAREQFTSPYRNLQNELPGLRWEPPAADKYTSIARYAILRQAQQFLHDSANLQ